MTVLTTNASSGPFTPNGSTTTFPFTFVAQSVDDVQVVRIASDSTLTPLGGYIVTGLTGSGGSVVFGTAPAAGDPIYILSAPNFEQQANFANQGPWSPTTMNNALDRAAMRSIYLLGLISRAIFAPIGETLGLLPTRANRANKILAFDYKGDPIATTAGAGVGAKGDPGGNTMAIGLFTGAALLSVPVGTDAVRTSGHTVLGQGIADYFYDAAVDSTFVSANPRTSFISANSRGFRLAFNGLVNVASFGAIGDGATDCTTALQAALDYLNANGGGIFYVPPGTFKVTAWLRVWPKTIIRGAGRQSSIITSTHVGGGGATAGENVRNGSVFVSVFAINSSNAASIGLEDLTVQNTNSGNVGAAYYDEGGSFIHGKNFRAIGFKYGAVLDQSELAHFDTCEFSNQHAVSSVAGAGVYLVNGALLTAGAAGAFTNMITFDRCQFNQPSTTYCILDAGGETHSANRCNFNGGISAIRMSGGAKWRLDHNEYESQVNHIVDMQLYDPTSTVAGSNVVDVDAGLFSATSGKSSINCASGGGSLSVGGGAWFSGGAGTYAIAGVVNMSAFWLGHALNATTATDIYDKTQRATYHNDPSLADVLATRPAPNVFGNQVAISWEGTYGLVQSRNYGSAWQPLRFVGQPVEFYYAGTKVAEVGIELGVSTYFNIPGGNEFRIAGTRVLSSRQAAIPNSTSASADMATINTILATLRTHGLIAP